MRLSLSWRAALGFAAKAAISALILWLVAKRFDLTGVRASFDAASRPLLTAAFAAFLLIPVLGGLRWWIVLRGLGARTRLFEITAIFSAANVVGQILPSIAGDGFRVWLTVRRGHPLGVAVQSVFLERVFMVLALLTLALATAPLLAAHTGQPAAIWVCAALLAAGAGGLGVLMWADRLVEFVDARPLRPLARAAAQTRAMVLSRWGVWTAVASVAGNLTFALAAMMLGRALGVAATPLDFLAIMPAVTLATTLPLSLGGWGVREGAFVLLLGHVGVPAADALTLSLLYGVGGVLCGLPGMLAFVGRTLSMPGLERRRYDQKLPPYQIITRA